MKQYRSLDIDQKRNTIGFYIQHEYASQITLAGTFNQWSRDVLFREPGRNGIWKIEIPMLPEGKYHYKFFINDELWMEDVNNPYRAPDGFNGFKSVLSIEPN